EDAVGQAGDERHGRVEQQEPGGGPGVGGRVQFTAVLGQACGQFGACHRRVGDAEGGGDAGHVGDVAVAAGGVERAGAVPLVGAQERVDLREVHPAQQPRVVGAVRAPVGGGAAHGGVHRPDPVDRPLGAVGGAVGGDGEEGAGALEPPPGVAAESGVSGDGGHGEGVQRLVQQGG